MSRQRACVIGKTYQFLLRCQYFGSSILLVHFRRHIVRSMLLKTSLHAIDAAPADLELPMDGGWVEASLKEFLDLLLNLRRLLA